MTERAPRKVTPEHPLSGKGEQLVQLDEWVRDGEVLEIEGAKFKVLYVFVRMVEEHEAPAHPPYYVQITPA
jgi:hypothetical protein